MTRPTLYLTNWSSSALHGLGCKLCAMAKPRRWEQGVGRVFAATPPPHLVSGALDGSVSIGDYRAACEAIWAENDYRPGHLRADGMGVLDGDSLLCACARPGSPKRTHPCHLELLAPYLVRAGWDVVLHGQRITLATLTVGWQRFESVPVYADGDRAGEAMLAEDYGWPATQEAGGDA